MKKALTAIFVVGLLYSACHWSGLDCVDNKTGMYRSSSTLQFSKENDLFSFKLKPNKAVVKLDNGASFNFRNAWVERKWKYECINNRAIVQKDTMLQFVIDAGYSRASREYDDYWLMAVDHHYGEASGAAVKSVLEFPYHGQDAIKLAVVKWKVGDTTRFGIDTILFSK